MIQNKKKAIADFHRNIIVETAEKLFSQKGIEKTTMDEIAKESEYSKSTIYVYFKSKEEIYNCIILRGMGELRDKIKEVALLNKDFCTSYYEIGKTLVRFNDEKPLYFNGVMGRINVNTNSPETSEVCKSMAIIGEEINNICTSIIKNGINEGIVREDVDPYKMVFVLWGSSAGIVKLVDNKKEYMEKTLKTSKEEFLEYSFKTLLSSILK